MKLAIDVEGCDVDSIYLSKATEAALKGLEDYEAHFVIQKVREHIAFNLSFELREWYEREIESPRRDLVKVGRLAEASRLLLALSEKGEL
jgi:hypothetical protein